MRNYVDMMVNLPPCIVTCPGKPDGSGLWATELGVVLQSTKLPYVTRIYPFTHCPAAGEHLRFAGLIEWALEGTGPLADGTMPLLVIDARYLNTPRLRDSQAPWLKVSRLHQPRVVSELEETRRG